MTQEPMLFVRGLATLACLVGVPAIALVGIAGDGGSSVWKSAAAKSSAGHDEPVRRLRAADDRTQPATHHAQAIPKTLPVTPAVAIEEHGRNDIVPSAGSIAGASGDNEPRGLAAPTVAATPDLMTRQLERLQELGATYYRLESAPHSAADFAFHCRVAGVARAFEASDPVATNAIADVLSQIEAMAVASRASQAPASETATTAAAGPSSIYRR